MKTHISAAALLLALLCSCNDTTKENKETRRLDQLSTEQLRTFIKGDTTGVWQNKSDMHQGKLPPPLQKPYSEKATLIDLVAPGELKCGSMSLFEVINKRRSRREYTEDSFTNEELSFLLWCTQGISAFAKYENEEIVFHHRIVPPGGKGISSSENYENGEIAYHLRTVPSGGARYPFETYLVINRVKGIKPGLYRFLPVEHKLLLIEENEQIAPVVQTACFGQTHIRDAAVVFIWAVIPYRTEWKYGYIAHKLIAIEAGHICQNLYLAAESIGGGACANLGYHQQAIDELIGVDGKDEFTVYVASTGKIKTE